MTMPPIYFPPLPSYAIPAAPGQYGIDGYVFGGPLGINNVWIQNTSVQPSSMQTQDATPPNADVTIFGVDSLPSNTITFTGFVRKENDPAGTLKAYETFARFWTNPGIRLATGAVSELDCWYKYSSEIRIAYGRGRSITPTMGTVFQSTIPFVATFITATPFFYSYTPATLLLDWAQQLTAGYPVTSPKTTPMVTGQWTVSNAKANAVNSSGLPTWPVIVFYGPCKLPSLSFTAIGKNIGYNGQLGASDQLTIDTRPWITAANLNGSMDVAGNLSGNASMDDLILLPGATPLSFTGTPVVVSGYAAMRCRLTWWPANQLIGG